MKDKEVEGIEIRDKGSFVSTLGTLEQAELNSWMSIVNGGLFADGKTLVAGFIAEILKKEFTSGQGSEEKQNHDEVIDTNEVDQEEISHDGQLLSDQNDEAYEQVEHVLEHEAEQSQIAKNVEASLNKRRISGELPSSPKQYYPPSLDELMEQLSMSEPNPQLNLPFPTTKAEHEHAVEVEDPVHLNEVIGEPGIPNDAADPMESLVLAADDKAVLSTDLGEVDPLDITFENSESQNLSANPDREALLDEKDRLNSSVIVGGLDADGYPLITGLTSGPSTGNTDEVRPTEEPVISLDQGGYENNEIAEPEKVVELDQGGYEGEQQPEVDLEAAVAIQENKEIGLDQGGYEVEQLIAAQNAIEAQLSSTSGAFPNEASEVKNTGEIPLDAGGYEGEFSTTIKDDEYPKALEAMKVVEDQEKELISEPKDPEEEDELVARGEEAPKASQADPVGRALTEFGSNASLKSFDPNTVNAGTPPEVIRATGIAEAMKFDAATELSEHHIVGGLLTDGVPLIFGIQAVRPLPGTVDETVPEDEGDIAEKVKNDPLNESALPDQNEAQKQEKSKTEQNPSETHEGANDEVTEPTEEFHTACDSLKEDTQAKPEDEEGYVKLISSKSESRDGPRSQVYFEHEGTPINAEELARIEHAEQQPDAPFERHHVIHVEQEAEPHKTRNIPIIIEENSIEVQEALKNSLDKQDSVKTEDVGIDHKDNITHEETPLKDYPDQEKATESNRIILKEPLERWASEEDLRAVGTDQSGQVPQDVIKPGEGAYDQSAQQTPTGQSERVIPILVQGNYSAVDHSAPTGQTGPIGTQPTAPSTEKHITFDNERLITIERPSAPNNSIQESLKERSVERNVPIRLVSSTNGLALDLPSPGARSETQESGFASVDALSPLETTVPSGPVLSGPVLTDPVLILSSILANLKRLKMTDKPKYDNIVARLKELEEEMRIQNTGLPPDDSLTQVVGEILQSEYPNSDLQIVVSTSRKSTSHTQFYETETPGMVGLAPDQLRDLQTKLMDKISGRNDYGKNVETKDQPDDLKRRDATEEGWTNEDGTESVHTRSVRQVTTTQSSVKGLGEHPQPNGEFIRLKVNEQVYDGQSDPQTHHIRLVPIQRIPVKYY
ncbi:unnamed protein product [Bursaphelenchus okinawaensis]|uniref:Uncharacterized protein n=1 Tax=Bursaphelenchus okinawaensis TaxID=465554 RepID=A0A811KUE8_9BILA|nr:unnamed protein product [Bursaphelenchus okinawaensis]CAG9112174.1 unnamed protein product [Bursaphelenchus okinawaensis]